MSEQQGENGRNEEEQESSKAEPEVRETRIEAAPAESKTGGGLLAILLALVAIGIASWPAYETWQSKTAGPAEKARLDTLLDRQKTEIDLASGQVSVLAARLDMLESEDSDAAMNELRAQVAADIDAFREELGSRPKDWLFAEVEYLVRMANQRVLMESDPAAALQLLESADEIIRDTEGLTAHTLREALAMDIAALRTIQSPDVQGIFLELSAQIRQVPSLSRELPQYEPPLPVADTAPDDSMLARLLGLVKKAGQRLSSLVDFRRDINEIKPILPPEEEYYLRQNLMLKLQMAQLALLESDQALFESAITEADAWIAEYFDADHGVTIAMRGSLGSLKGVPVARDLPDISGSLKAARTVLAGWEDKP